MASCYVKETYFSCLGTIARRRSVSGNPPTETRKGSYLFLLPFVHVLLKTCRFSLPSLSRLHHPLCLHLSWSPGINLHLRASSVGVDPRAAPSSPNYPFHFPLELIFISEHKIKTPTYRSGDGERDGGREEAGAGGRGKKKGDLSPA